MIIADPDFVFSQQLIIGKGYKSWSSLSATDGKGSIEWYKLRLQLDQVIFKSDFLFIRY